MSSTDERWEMPKFLKDIFGPDFFPPFPILPESRRAFRRLHAAQDEILDRPTLDLKTRAIIIFSITVALGYKAECKLWIQGMRNMGYSVEEIAEMILLAAIYSGVSRGIDANMLLREVLEEDEERGKTKGNYYRLPRS